MSITSTAKFWWDHLYSLRAAEEAKSVIAHRQAPRHLTMEQRDVYKRLCVAQSWRSQVLWEQVQLPVLRKAVSLIYLAHIEENLDKIF